jgi:hypothetical protein
MYQRSHATEHVGIGGSRGNADNCPSQISVAVRCNKNTGCKGLYLA